MFRAVSTSYRTCSAMPICCRAALSGRSPLMMQYSRLLHEKAPKSRRVIKIPDQLRMASDRLRTTAASTGRRLRSFTFQESTRVRFTSLAQRPVGVFHRCKNNLVAQAVAGKNKGVSRLQSSVQSTRHKMKTRVDSARERVERRTEGYVSGLKRQMKRFGYTGLSVYLTIGALDWMSFYYLIKWGVDVDALIGFFGVKTSFTGTDVASFWTIVGAAYACHKALLPVRLILTVLLTRPLWRFLVRKGLLKRPPKQTPKVHIKT